MSANLRLGLAVVALVCGAPALAQQQYGDWVVASKGQLVFAVTMNDAEHTFGLFCFQTSHRCFWMLSNDNECEDGARYPVLVNTDRSAMNAEVACMKVDSQPRYAFTDFDAMEHALLPAAQVGIAFPLKGGAFNVSRFSLMGEGSAVHAARKMAAQEGPL